MFILDCIRSFLYYFMPLLPILVYLLFCSKNFVEWFEYVTGLKLIENNINYENKFENEIFGVIQSSTFYLVIDILFMISFVIALVYRYYFGFCENIFFAVVMLPFIYSTFITSLRRNTFHVDVLNSKNCLITPDNYYSSNTYNMLSAFVGFFPTMGGTIFLILGYTPYILLFGLFIQTIVLFPDVISKVIPLDFKKWEGILLLALLAIPSWIIAFHIARPWVGY